MARLLRVGARVVNMDLAWRAYVRRFDLEHTVRFAKQTLGWTTPRPRHPAQAERWTWLVLAAYAQLRLARQVAGDQRLPWERPRPQPRRSPARVRRGFPQLLVRLGSPASAPKPAGCPPGRLKGRSSGPARRYPAIKKPTTKPRRSRPRQPRQPDRLGPLFPPSTEADSQLGTPTGSSTSLVVSMRLSAASWRPRSSVSQRRVAGGEARPAGRSGAGPVPPAVCDTLRADSFWLLTYAKDDRQLASAEQHGEQGQDGQVQGLVDGDHAPFEGGESGAGGGG